MSKFLRWVFAGALLTGLAGCAHKPLLSGASGFYLVDEGFYRGPRPMEDEWSELTKLGVKTVISLEEDAARVAEERGIVEGLGMHFSSLPMSLYERPADSTVIQFLETVLNRGAQPVFLHCESGKDKTGTLVAVYRVAVQGWGPKEGYHEAKRFGFWPYRGDAELKKFIHQLKDKKIFVEKAQERR
ncbi:MAG: tyrosine-protein phosphatase [Candidatus Omnitrophota bacterium]|nr:tyrosine-protein phosphatase [Candidatus Omnitrophota bacterium]